MTPQLDVLLRENRGYAFEYRGGLTNHASMALVALARLGAPDERMRAFFDAYRARLEPAAVDPLTSSIADEIRTRGAEAVLRARLAATSAGLAGAAFHGLIRVAFARMSGLDDELAPALAYLERCAEPVARASSGRESDLDALVDELRARAIEAPSGSLISDRLRAVSADARFQAVVSRLKVDRSTLSQVSGLGARWYLAREDFVTLHVLTGAHALRSVMPLLSDPAPALHALAAAALACFVVAGMPTRVDARGRARAEWSEIGARAVASDDDHLAKLVVACQDEEHAAEDAIYRIVATHAARRGST